MKDTEEFFRDYCFAANSRIGGRQENQDTLGYSVTPYGFIVVVCDGMGGGPGGKTASLIAADTIIESVKAGRVLEEDQEITNTRLLECGITSANQAIREYVMEHPELEGMGTTATALLLNEKCAALAHVGDSRIYQYRHGRELFRTNDHSRVAEMVRNKEISEKKARMSAISNVITRALGPFESVEVELDVRGFEKGDRFVLCTDGVWGAVSDKQLTYIVTHSTSLEGTVDQVMIDIDNVGKSSGGHHDNLTCAILETKVDSIIKNPMDKKERRLFALQTLALLASLIGLLVLGVRLHKANKALERVTITTGVQTGVKQDNAATVKFDDQKAVTTKVSKTVETRKSRKEKKNQ